MAEDVLQDHHRVVDHHAAGERQAGQADDVEGASAGEEHQKDRRERDRDRDGGDQHGLRAAQEEQQDEDRQAGAQAQVLPNETHRRPDVGRLLVESLQLQIEVAQRELAVQLLQCLVDALDQLDDVRADLAPHAHADGGLAVHVHEAGLLAVAVHDPRHVAQEHGTGRQLLDDDVGQVDRPLRPTDGAHDRLAPRRLDRAAADVQVAALDRGVHLVEGDAPCNEQLRIDAHLDLALRAADDEERRDARYALEARLDLVLDDAADLVDVVVRANGDPVDDLAVAGAGDGDDRLVGLQRQARDLVELVDDVDQPGLAVEPVLELERDRALPLRRRAAHLDQTLNVLEDLLELARDLLLDLLGAGAAEGGRHRDARYVDDRLELHGNAPDRQRAEEDDQEHAHGHRVGPADSGLDGVHS